MIEQGICSRSTTRHAQAIEESPRQLNDALIQAEAATRSSAPTRPVRSAGDTRAQRAGSDEQEPASGSSAPCRRPALSAMYEVLPERLIIAADPSVSLAPARSGAEGQDRLAAVAGHAAPPLVAQLPGRFHAVATAHRRSQ